LLASRNLWSR